MLVLTRNVQDSIKITTKSGEEIIIVVLGIERNKVRLGFDADRNITIWRTELEQGGKNEDNINPGSSMQRKIDPNEENNRSAS